MSKSQLRTEIQRYIAFGYSIDDACMQVNNANLNKFLSNIYAIQQELHKAAA